MPSNMMKIRQYKLKDVLQVHTFFQAYRSDPPLGWWFRGQADAKWPLLPKAGRDKYLLPDNRDIGRFRDWRQQAVAYYENFPVNDWESFAIAQHHGLSTRLLDWTSNPLVATYFAVNSRFAVNGAVYCYEPNYVVNIEKASLDDEIHGFGFIPTALSKRILNQKALFTIHSPPNKEIEVTEHPILGEEHSNLAKLIIPKKLKRELIKDLNHYGINMVTMFPDLDGLSNYVNWRTIEMVQEEEQEENGGKKD